MSPLVLCNGFPARQGKNFHTVFCMQGLPGPRPSIDYVPILPPPGYSTAARQRSGPRSPRGQCKRLVRITAHRKREQPATIKTHTRVRAYEARMHSIKVQRRHVLV